MSFGVSVGDVIKLCEMAGRVYKNCRDCTGEYRSLTSEARSLANLLEDIQDKYDKIPQNRRQQLVDAYDPCIEVLQELDKLLLHYNSLDTKAARTWNRLKYDPERSKSLREKLVASVAMLNTFYTSLIHDSQVLILEALERLEKDYRGGHRGESVASIEMITSEESEGDDEAWTQILRDLDDVGVSQQEALSYRDLIVDWLITAVNEGRLQEQQSEQTSFLTTSPTPSSDGRPQLSAGQRPLLSPSMTSLPDSVRRNISSSTASQVSGTDAASLYASPDAPSVPSQQIERHSHVQALGVGLDYTGHAVSPELTVQIPPDAFVHPGSVPPVHALPQEIPPSYHDETATATVNLDWTAQRIVAAWAQNDFLAAEKLIEEQLGAVERGQTVSSGAQPDRRILRHLIGVCASFTGNFMKAKHMFESVFNGIYLNRESLDDGDIAAARWLGDVCLHLRELHNALLAYSVAFEGSIGRFGVARDRTRRASLEVRLLDHWLFAFGRIEYAFHQTLDPTDIFTSIHATEKSNLVHAVKTRLYGMEEPGGKVPGPPTHQYTRPTWNPIPRPEFDIRISEGFLLAPLISPSTWPLPWDPTFSPLAAVQLGRFMNIIQIASEPVPLLERPLPTSSLRSSKSLHYVTKRGSTWLISAVKTGLREMGIEYTEHGYETSIICCLNRHQDGFAFSEGVEISFKKLQFRNVHGITISEMKWATRNIGRSRYGTYLSGTSEFKEIIKSILDAAEIGKDGLAPSPLSPQTPPLKKRPTYG
ncbi:hypothetical protein NX059_000686 [Plenodomus lindquistii]|nr:hypothetical protein NX059_000686 [Plenodomus lindquistii]